MAHDADGLTPRQKTWCDEYIRSGNGVEAARQAGYSSPRHSSRSNTHNAACSAYIAARMQPTVDRRIADADEVLAFLSRVIRGEERDQFGLDISAADRIKAAQELLKRYAVADDRQRSTMQRLDAIFVQFRAALDAPPVEAPAVVLDVPAQLATQGGQLAGEGISSPGVSSTQDAAEAATASEGEAL